MHNVFVTGPDGLLGSNLVRELISRKYNIIAMVQKGRDPFTLKGLPIQKVYGDITSSDDVEQLSKGCDYFIHMAALTDMWPTRGGKHFLINVEGTKNVINAVLKNDIKRLIHVGSASSFGYGCLDKPGDEDSPYKSSKYKLDYLDSKQKAQQLVMNAIKNTMLPALIVCPTFMIGPYDVKPGSGALVMALAKRNLPALPGGGKNWVSAKDVAVATCNALTMGRIGESYILGGENLSFKEVIRKMATALDIKDYPRLIMPDLMLKTMGAFSSSISVLTQRSPRLSYPMACVACDHHYFSPAKAIQELNMPQTPIEQATQELYNWFLENNYL